MRISIDACGEECTLEGTTHTERIALFTLAGEQAHRLRATGDGCVSMPTDLYRHLQSKLKSTPTPQTPQSTQTVGTQTTPVVIVDDVSPDIKDDTPPLPALCTPPRVSHTPPRVPASWDLESACPLSIAATPMPSESNMSNMSDWHQWEQRVSRHTVQ